MIFYVLVFMAVSYVFVKNAMHMFQQNRYEIYRYLKWCLSFKPFFLVLSIIYSVLMILVSFLLKEIYLRHIVTVVITLVFAIILIKKESEKEYIKPLVYTARVKRSLVLFFLVQALMIYVLCKSLLSIIGLVGILSLILPYILIIPVALILKPLEWAIKKKYENEARKILAENPFLTKVGITGSYGKTTTKNIVTEILSSNFYTLMTPASFNTPMGITRTVRENLKPIHEVFVCEMGADHVKDISYLMDMVKPKYGIVSSIGPQHLNTFGSLENIIKEKMQEIEMLPFDGVGIINIDNEYIANYPISNVCKVVSIGVNNQSADLHATNVIYSKDGSSFDVEIKGEVYNFTTKLLGEHNITNILCGIALALELNVEIKDIVKAVENIKQVEHRLELKKINGFNFIDDAFNSNPSGCKFALKALSMMDEGKRVVVTPGLIDLGSEENKANYDFGKFMLGKTDLVILVGKSQTQYIYKGLKDSGYNMENVLVVDKVVEAFNYIYTNLSPTDTILLENDLPDAFSK